MVVVGVVVRVLFSSNVAVPGLLSAEVSGRVLTVGFSCPCTLTVPVPVLISCLSVGAVTLVVGRVLTPVLVVSLVGSFDAAAGVSATILLYLSLKLVGVVGLDTEEMPPDATLP